MAIINKGKLKWRSKRSILELDLFFDKFIQSDGIDSLSEDDLNTYAKLLDLEDCDLLLLFQGRKRLLDADMQKIVDKICAN